MDASGNEQSARSKYVIDASGHSSAIARFAGERLHSKYFQNVAVFGYFENGKRLPAPSSGNIFCAAFERGWFWYIPLTTTLTSVGAVIGQEHADVLRTGHAEALTDLIASCIPIRELLAEGTRVTSGPYGQVRVRKDYSYCNQKFWRRGLILVGDSACFVDPVFSSGVHLATYAGLLAARSVNTCLRGLLDEDRVVTEYEQRYKREYRYFYDFLIAFYDMDQDLDEYYWKARKVINSREGGNEAFVQLVGGIATSGEQIFSTGQEFVQAHQGV